MTARSPVNPGLPAGLKCRPVGETATLRRGRIAGTTQWPGRCVNTPGPGQTLRERSNAMDGIPVTRPAPSSAALPLLETAVRWSIAATRRCSPVPHAGAAAPAGLTTHLRK